MPNTRPIVTASAAQGRSHVKTPSINLGDRLPLPVGDAITALQRRFTSGEMRLALEEMLRTERIIAASEALQSYVMNLAAANPDLADTDDNLARLVRNTIAEFQRREPSATADAFHKTTAMPAAAAAAFDGALADAVVAPRRLRPHLSSRAATVARTATSDLPTALH